MDFENLEVEGGEIATVITVLLQDKDGKMQWIPWERGSCAEGPGHLSYR